MARFWEGTGLLHMMRGEWFDSVSLCVTFSRAALADKPLETKYFRHTLVRLMSICHGSALKEIGGDEASECEYIDPFGLDVTTLQHLTNMKREHFNRVEVVLHLIQIIITQGLEDGILKVPPPILSRVYQTLSRGFVRLLDAKKIADTRFPFPFAQLISFQLFYAVVLIPVLVTAVMENIAVAAILTFLPVFGMACLNFIGVELENPFGKDANDLPLEHFQAEMNKCLLMLLHQDADELPSLDEENYMRGFDDIRHNLVEVGLYHEGGPDDHGLPTKQESIKNLDNYRSLRKQRTLERDAIAELEAIADNMNTANATAGSTSGQPEQNQEEEMGEIAIATEVRKVKRDELLQGLEGLVVAMNKMKDGIKAQEQTLLQSTAVIKEFGEDLKHLLNPLGIEPPEGIIETARQFIHMRPGIIGRA